MRIAFAASLCLAMFACGQGGSLSGSSGRKTADSRSARNSGDSKDTTKNKSDDKQDQAPQDDDAPSDDTRVVAPEVISAAYLTCGAVVSKANPPAEGVKYFGCIAVDAQKNRLDLKNVKVSYVLKDLAGTALDVPTVALPDADKDVVWAVPAAVYAKGVNPEATFPGATPAESNTTIPRKCFLKIGNEKDGFKEQESQCNAPA